MPVKDIFPLSLVTPVRENFSLASPDRHALGSTCSMRRSLLTDGCPTACPNPKSLCSKFPLQGNEDKLAGLESDLVDARRNFLKLYIQLKGNNNVDNNAAGDDDGLPANAAPGLQYDKKLRVCYHAVDRSLRLVDGSPIGTTTIDWLRRKG